MTSMPMLRAVPSTMRIAASMLVVLRSTSLVCAISRTCCFVTRPILSLCGTAEPFAMPAARLSSTAAGGVLTMNVKDRSWKMVTTTGRMRPSWPCVWALKPLQNSMMFTPCWPSAGPTGGEGLALPAGICSFTIAWTFFIRWAPSHPLDLVVLEFDRRRAAEDRHHHFHAPALGVDVLDHALEVHERTVDDAYLVAPLEDGLGLGLLRAGLHLPHDLVHLVAGERDRARPRAHEPGDLGGRAHQLPRVVGQLHLHQHVAGEELLLGLALLLVADLDHLLGRHQHAPDLLLEVEDLRARLDRLRDLVLEPGIRVDDEPLLGDRRRRRLTAHFKILSTMRASAMSTPPRNRASTTVTTTTTAVELINSCRLGHVTLWDSTSTSRANSRTRAITPIVFRRRGRRPLRAPPGLRGQSLRSPVPRPSSYRRADGRGGGIRTPIPRIWSPVL